MTKPIKLLSLGAGVQLTEAGWEVVNPADNFGGRTDLSRGSYLRIEAARHEQATLLDGVES